MFNICCFALRSLPRNIGYKQNTNVNNNKRFETVFSVVATFMKNDYQQKTLLQQRLMHSVKRNAMQRAKKNDRCELQTLIESKTHMLLHKQRPTIKVNCSQISVPLRHQQHGSFCAAEVLAGNTTEMHTLPGSRCHTRFLVLVLVNVNVVVAGVKVCVQQLKRRRPVLQCLI